MYGFESNFYEHGRHRELVVLLHGYTFSSARMHDFCELIHDRMPNADIFVPNMPHRRLFSRTPSTSIVAEILTEVDGFWRVRARQGAYREIWLVGHSCGAVLARKLFLAAWGVAPDVQGGGESPRPWAVRVRRLIFVAGVNRGWTVTSALNWLHTTMWKFGTLVGELALGGRATIFDYRRGAPFLIETRLQWLALMTGTRGHIPRVVVVQTLGTVDDFVSPDDSIDFAIDDLSANRVYLLEIPQTGHLDAVELASSRNEITDRIRSARRKIMAVALSRSRARLRERALKREHLVDILPPTPDPAVDSVAFVIHGIRDRGFWTQKIARKIQQFAQEGGVTFRTVTATYGYFAMLPFVLPWTRRRKVEWFMDIYVETRARFPRATFHYVGHSNGTYLVARALRNYPSARFGRIVFAGSVVRSDYDWGKFLSARAGRVERVLNYVASGDWVVAIFPKGLEPVSYFDLGGAGHTGFRQAATNAELIELKFVRGSHGAGIREGQWDEISTFVVQGVAPTPAQWKTNCDASANQHFLWAAAGRIAPVIVATLAVAIAGGFAWLLFFFPLDGPDGRAGLLTLLALAVYVWILRIAALRF